MLGQPGSDALLEVAGQATLLYVVRDEASLGGQQQHGRGVTVRVQHPDSAAGQAAASISAEHVEACEQQHGMHADSADDEPGTGAAMDPDTERDVCMRIVEACQAFLAGAPTSAAQDAILLAELGSACHVSLHSSSDSGGGCEPGTAVMAQQAVHGQWQRLCHLRMALQYRLQRKLLLSRVAGDLAAQACMLSGCM